MKQNDVQVGREYVAKVSDKMTTVKIIGESRHGGWDAVNTATGKNVSIKNASRLRYPATETTEPTDSAPDTGATCADTGEVEEQGQPAPEIPTVANVGVVGGEGEGAKTRRSRAKREAGEKKLSGLDAAAKVLEEAGEALDCKTIAERAVEKGYWKTGGKTPAATLNASIHREIQKKGTQSRFVKSGRGLFTVNHSHQ